MRVDVQLLNAGRIAIVDHVPSLAARVVFRSATITRIAVRVGSVWRYDDTGRVVDAMTANAIDDHERDQLRERLRALRASTAPPG